MDTFEKVTGPKTDRWIVKTLGALIGVVGGVLIGSGLRGQPDSAEIRVLGSGSAAALAGSDMIYSLKGRIRMIYLLEAVVELGLVAGWFISRRRR